MSETANSVRRNTIMDVIYGDHGIKNASRLLLDNGYYLGALTILFSAIDAMGNLDRPVGKASATRSDYIGWANTYLAVNCVVRSDVIPTSGTSRVTGLELYAARCAVLHTYGSESELSKMGHARQVAWMVNSRTNTPVNPPAVYKPGVSKEAVVIDINYFHNMVFAGIERFVIDHLAHEEDGAVFDERLRNLLTTLPFLPNML